MVSIRVAAVQFNHRPGDKEANLAIIEDFARRAGSQAVELIAFPEMCITGYWHVRNLTRKQIEGLAEPIPSGESCQKLMALSKQLGMTIGAGLIERGDGSDFFNSYFVAMPNGKFARHRKLHCFISEHMSSGNQFTVFEGPQGCRIGVLTCWDNNLVENVRIVALDGAEILLAPHQTGGCDSRSPGAMGRIDPQLWIDRAKDPQTIEEEFKGPKGRGWLMRWLPSRAHDNGMFVVFSNGVGIDDDEVRTGNAMVIGPYGEILVETSKPDDDMVVVDLDLSVLPLSTGRRWIRGRRPELYVPICQETGRELDPRSARFSKDSCVIKSGKISG